MGMPEDIQRYRKEIDRIDDEILRLLNERSKNVKEIGKLKKQSDHEGNLHTPGREAEIVD
ncbi:MAG: chorismate mutase, partial [Candidatus Methylomirabilales bacterium]